MTAPTALVPSSETELRDPVAAWLRMILPDPVVVDELDGGNGIADLVGAAAPTLQERQAPPVREAIQLALVDYLSVPREQAELRAWAPLGWRQLQDRGLNPLVDAGVIAIDDDGRFCCAWTEHDPFELVVAVELKLRNWRKALSQAFRYRLFADLAYIAMPERYAVEAVAAAVGAGIGVLVVEETRAFEISPPEQKSLVAPGRRRLARERLLHALSVDSPRPIGGSPLLNR